MDEKFPLAARASAGVLPIEVTIQSVSTSSFPVVLEFLKTKYSSVVPMNSNVNPQQVISFDFYKSAGFNLSVCKLEELGVNTTPSSRIKTFTFDELSKQDSASITFAENVTVVISWKIPKRGTSADLQVQMRNAVEKLEGWAKKVSVEWNECVWFEKKIESFKQQVKDHTPEETERENKAIVEKIVALESKLNTGLNINSLM